MSCKDKENPHEHGHDGSSLSAEKIGLPDS